MWQTVARLRALLRAGAAACRVRAMLGRRLVTLALLWPLCKWFDAVKTRHRGAWWTHYT